MNTANILKALEKLDHDQRWKYMIELGKKAKNYLTLSQSLTSLSVSDVHYHRVIALMSAHGSHDRAMIARALEDASNLHLSSAITLAAQHLDADQIVDLVPGLSKKRRHLMFMALLRVRRTEVNDRLYNLLGIHEKRQLISYTSETFVRSLDASHFDGLDSSQWARLASRFPSLTQQLLSERLSSTLEPSWLLQSSVTYVLHRMFRFSPDTGLILLKQAMTRMEPRRLPFSLYAKRFASDISTLVLANQGSLSVTFPLNALKRLDNGTLCQLAQAGTLTNLSHVFAKLLPEQRMALYASVGEAWRDANGALPLSYVKALSENQREAEAKHVFSLPLLASQPLLRLPYLGVLSFPQALVLAEPYLSQPEGDLRAAAVKSLVEGGRYHSDRLGAILDFCLKRENEQDPVRLAMIDALASLPPSRWSSAHLTQLKGIIDAALRARDCSFQSMAEAARLLMSMVVYQTDFVVAELPGLVERMGRLNTLSLESRMTDAQMIRLAPVLIPLMKVWIARNHHELALGLISCFGRRAKAVPEFAQMMIKMTSDQRGHVARSGLNSLIRMEFKPQVAELIPALIKQDEGWIQVREVAEYLHRYRQSLLTPFLTYRVYKGRFSSGSTATIPGFYNGFARWTESQQQQYAKALQGIINSSKRNAWELYQVVNQLAAMPSIDLSPLIKLADVRTSDAALRDKSLEALGRADAGRGVAALLDALDDARARVAIYALRRSLLNMPGRQALNLLSAVTSTKITVVKEVIRLAGEFEGEETYTFLRRFARTENLHPDVEIALLRAFWGYLNHDEVWADFHAAARNPRAALARSTIRIPQEGLSVKGQQQLAIQMMLLLGHTDAQVQRETLERLVFMPLGFPDTGLRNALIPLLENIDPSICQLVAQALLAMYASDNDAELVNTFAGVTQAQSLVAIVSAYAQRKQINSYGLAWSAQQLGERLLARRWQPGQAIRLAIMMLNPSVSLAFIQQIQQSELLHPGAVEAGLTTLRKMAIANTRRELELIEFALRSASDTGLRRLGLGLLCELADKYGWNKALRESLQGYRIDPSLWISDVAELIIPPPTLPEAESIN
ncbi:hypothetical protein [Limnobaculum xujianqingii]|uniref:hypothetical protein n=1 Tax=Limnobaculum xujianqingii TaxID=2738837 RepID=UPI001128A0D0|nr:hypothetical protein [Limnobaculum xujianqingii]